MRLSEIIKVIENKSRKRKYVSVGDSVITVDRYIQYLEDIVIYDDKNYYDGNRNFKPRSKEKSSRNNAI